MQNYKSVTKFFVLLVVLTHGSCTGLLDIPIDIQNTKWFRVVCPVGNDLKDLNQPMVIRKGSTFGIQTRLPYPGQSYQWNEDDQWQLIEYPVSAFVLEIEESATPKGFGGDLLKWWAFKACKVGSFRIVLQRYSQQVAINIQVE